MRSVARKNLSSVLLATHMALLQPMLVVLADDSSALPLSAATTNCENSQTPAVLDCPDPEHLKMSYVSRGSVDCGDALTLDQAKLSPSIRADPAIVEAGALYSLILVDTTNTTVSTNTFFSFDSVHPILHYGAVNVQGSVLLEGLSLDRTDKLDVFSPYEGPSPPESGSMWAAEGVESQLFAYEYMLAAQSQGSAPIDVPQLESTRNFDYDAFFAETVGVGFANLTASTHFVSGWCVTELPTTTGRKDPTEMPTEDPTEAATDEVKVAAEEPAAEVQDPSEAPKEIQEPTSEDVESTTTTFAQGDAEANGETAGIDVTEETESNGEAVTGTDTTGETESSDEAVTGTEEEKLPETPSDQPDNTEASGGARTQSTTALWAKGLVFITTTWLFY